MTVVGIKVNAVACGDHRTIVKKIIFFFRDLMTVVGIMGIMAYDLMTVVGIKVRESANEGVESSVSIWKISISSGSPVLPKSISPLTVYIWHNQYTFTCP
jgi:hypothetical protein